MMYFSWESRQQDGDLQKLYLTQIRIDKLRREVNNNFLIPQWAAFLQKQGHKNNAQSTFCEKKL